MKAALAFCLLLIGCQFNEKPYKIDAGDLAYFRDARTGLCFAAMNSRGSDGYLHTSIANVPCEPVEHLLQK